MTGVFIIGIFVPVPGNTIVGIVGKLIKGMGPSLFVFGGRPRLRYNSQSNIV